MPTWMVSVVRYKRLSHLRTLTVLILGEAAIGVLATDCDDSDAALNPSASEIVGDGVDSDCDGTEMCFVDADSDGYRHIDDTLTITSADSDCGDSGEGAVDEPATDCDDSGSDLDQDGVADGFGINPGAQEIIVDGIDQDCDGGELVRRLGW